MAAQVHQICQSGKVIGGQIIYGREWMEKSVLFLYAELKTVTARTVPREFQDAKAA